MGIMGSSNNRSQNKTTAVKNVNILSVPTRRIIDEMYDDVTMMGNSKWQLNDNVLLEMFKDKNNETILKITDKSQKMLVEEILDITKIFFANRHHNGLTNHHDGTFEVNLTDRYADEDRQRRAASAAQDIQEKKSARELDKKDYRVHGYMVQEMIADANMGRTNPWKIDNLIEIELQKDASGDYHLELKPIGEKDLNATVVEDVAKKFGKGSITELTSQKAVFHFDQLK